MGLETKASGAETRDKILNAAETLFIDKGYSGTSLRAIASLAKVNLAAANYHFGSKSGLLAATVHRRVSTLNSRRLAALDRLESSGEVITIEKLMASFFHPFLAFELDTQLNRLMGRVFSEPASLMQPILKDEFSPVMQRYMAQIQAALPEVSSADLHWRMHFVIGAMVHLLNYDVLIQVDENNLDHHMKFKKLEQFAVAGLRQGPVALNCVNPEIPEN